jgi:uncharacterized protein (TIGR03000 family)
MYSMVLMAALTATPDVAGFGYGCLGGCTGCTGTVVSVGCGGCGGTTTSCFGSSCYGSSCYSSSCCGGVFPLFPRLRARLAGVFGGGCYGSCYGSSCYSSSCHSSSCYSSSCHSSACYGSGCYSSACYGSACYGSGCYSSGVSACYGSSCTGSACFGTSYHSPTPFVGSGSCFGTGGAVYYGADFHQGVMAPPVIGSGIIDGLGSVTPSVPTITIDRSAEYRAAQSKPAAAPARLTIELPAAAKLYVDGTLVKGDGEARNFHTPDLTAGKTFYYDLKAEVVVDGKTVTQEKRVLVKAGDANAESFEKLIAAVKSDRTDVAKK